MQKQFFAVQKRHCEKRTWWTLSCLYDVYLFSSLVDERITDAAVDKIENYYGVAIQSNIVKLKDMQNASGKYIFTWSWGSSNETLNERHQYCPVTPNSWCKYQVDQSIIQVFTTNKTVCHPSFAVSCIISDCLQIHYCRAVRVDTKPERKLSNMVGLVCKACALLY